MKRFPVSRLKLLVLALAPTLFLLLVGELGVRLYYFSRYHDLAFLLGPRAFAQVEYPATFKEGQTRRFAPCAGKELVFTVNGVGGRGEEWNTVKRPGMTRILAVGESSTFGMDNPDQATWPAYLELELRRQGKSIEVLNGGQPGLHLENILDLLSRWLPVFSPDVVIYYGGFNDADSIDLRIQRAQRESLLGRLTSWLHYRSMLYTYFLEKYHFFTRTRTEVALVPPLQETRQLTGKLITIVREHRAAPVIVLQATEAPFQARFAALRSDDRAAIAAALREAESSRTLRGYKAQILVELAIRPAAVERRVLVIDPRPYLENVKRSAHVFCNPIHLTDYGNEILAAYIARDLVPTLR